MKVREVMTRHVVTVTVDAPVKQARQLLVAHSITALPVLEAKGTLAGIVSEGDVLATEARLDPHAQASSPPAKDVAGIMTRNVVTVSPDAEVSQAARAMLSAGIKQLPVVRGGRVVGILSRRDLVKLIARRDSDIESELGSRLGEAGLRSGFSVNFDARVARIELEQPRVDRALAEAVALTVPGVSYVVVAGARQHRSDAGRPAQRSRRLP
ncbi:MAG TPA: CBS domain-containing protein [Candidatus Dormibacteraeota bacterium]